MFVNGPTVRVRRRRRDGPGVFTRLDANGRHAYRELVTLPDLITRPVFLFDLFHTLSTIRHAKVEGPETHELLGVSREVYVAALFGDSDLRLRGTLRDHVEIVADIARAAGSTVPAGRYPQIAQARAGRFAESRLRPGRGAGVVDRKCL